MVLGREPIDGGDYVAMPQRGNDFLKRRLVVRAGNARRFARGKGRGEFKGGLFTVFGYVGFVYDLLRVRVRSYFLSIFRHLLVCELAERLLDFRAEQSSKTCQRWGFPAQVGAIGSNQIGGEFVNEV